MRRIPSCLKEQRELVTSVRSQAILPVIVQRLETVATRAEEEVVVETEPATLAMRLDTCHAIAPMVAVASVNLEVI